MSVCRQIFSALSRSCSACLIQLNDSDAEADGLVEFRKGDCVFPDDVDKTIVPATVGSDAKADGLVVEFRRGDCVFPDDVNKTIVPATVGSDAKADGLVVEFRRGDCVFPDDGDKTIVPASAEVGSVGGTAPVKMVKRIINNSIVCCIREWKKKK